MTNTEWLRRRLLRSVQHTKTFSRQAAFRSMAEFFGPEGSIHEVIRHAKARKLMGAFRYEQVESDGLSYDQKASRGLAKTFVQRGIEKFQLYEETGNKEYLVDAFNYVLLEYTRPTHPDAHFASTERHDEEAQCSSSS
jgi:hypothetical protein